MTGVTNWRECKRTARYILCAVVFGCLRRLINTVVARVHKRASIEESVISDNS